MAARRPVHGARATPIRSGRGRAQARTSTVSSPGGRSASTMVVVERGGKRGDEQTDAPATEDVRRPVHVEVHATQTDEQRNEHRERERHPPVDESFAPEHVRERAADGGRHRGVAGGKSEGVFYVPGKPAGARTR